MKIRVEMIRECVGPLCCKPGISRSMSGMMEARKSRGMFTFTLRSLLVAFPVKYPNARCPTAYISFSYCFSALFFFLFFHRLFSYESCCCEGDGEGE